MNKAFPGDSWTTTGLLQGEVCILISGCEVAWSSCETRGRGGWKKVVISGSKAVFDSYVIGIGKQWGTGRRTCLWYSSMFISTWGCLDLFMYLCMYVLIYLYWRGGRQWGRAWERLRNRMTELLSADWLFKFLQWPILDQDEPWRW